MHKADRASQFSWFRRLKTEVCHMSNQINISKNQSLSYRDDFQRLFLKQHPFIKHFMPFLYEDDLSIETLQGTEMMTMKKWLYVAMLLEMRRVVPIKSLAGLTKLHKTGSQEFVIHVKKEHDYRLLSEQ